MYYASLCGSRLPCVLFSFAVFKFYKKCKKSVAQCHHWNRRVRQRFYWSSLHSYQERFVEIFSPSPKGAFSTQTSFLRSVITRNTSTLNSSILQVKYLLWYCYPQFLILDHKSDYSDRIWTLPKLLPSVVLSPTGNIHRFLFYKDLNVDICCSFPYWKYTQISSLHNPTRILVTFHFGTTTGFTCVVRNTGLRVDVQCNIHAINDRSRDNFAITIWSTPTPTPFHV